MENEKVEWRWCLVGNIVDKRIYGEDHEIRYGTKHFSPGTKVYVAPHQWGDGGENRVVLGNPRNKKGYIECVIRRDYLCNLRIKKVYSPLLLKRMSESKYDWWWDFDEKDQEWTKKMADEINEMNKSNPKIINNDTQEEFLSNIDKLHTTEMGNERIKNNLELDIDDVVEYCKNRIKDQECNIYRDGKNWYCEIDDERITVNACSYTIITAHKIK